MDTALAAYLTGITDEKAILYGPMAGPLMETAVVSAWRKAFLHRGEQPSMYYWRSSDGLEVDLIIERNNRLYPMEIKLTSTLRPRDADALEKWIKISETSFKKGVIFCNVRQWTFVTSNIQATPWDSL
jgi:predicted AAA+ superfamily ATPase